MINVVYKRLGQLAILVLITGCASEPVDYPPVGSPYTPPPLPAPKKPIKPATPVTPFYQDDMASSPYSKPSQNTNNYSEENGSGSYANSPAVQSFIQHMVQKHGFSENYLNGLFAQAHRLESVIRLESPAPSHTPPKPHEGSWTRYRDKFLTDAHISNGVAFWQRNADAIQKASETYGVDPEYIVGIIGVETYFGKNIGKTNIFDALTTLAFDTHRRAKYFTEELENFLLMTREEGIDPRQPVGSWAGAMGLGQFMPSSFRRLAVDFNNDGRRDLWHQHDAIGSVAHYFSRSGWQLNQLVTTETDSPNSAPDVIELSTYAGNEYWRVYHNFKVIKKYNNSNKYAMAVHQLAQAIKLRYYSQAKS